jgi:hypothetical protein
LDAAFLWGLVNLLFGLKFDEYILSFEVGVDDVVIGEQLQGLGDIEYNLPEFVLVVLDGGIELLVVDAVHLLVVVLLAFQLVESVAQGVSAFLVEYPSVFFVYEIVVQFH